MVAILSGKFKGQSLAVPKSGTRPTSSLVKKALFDSLRTHLIDCSFCDLFAGSGAVGLEALSQGASKVLLIESNKQAFTCIKANITKLKCEQDCKAYLKKAHSFLESLEKDLETIDIFFLDPPYDIRPEDSSSYESLLLFFDKKNLKADCKIILETKDPERIEKKMPHLNSLSLMTKKAYGDSYLFFIQKY